MNISQPKMRSTILSGLALVTPFFLSCRYSPCPTTPLKRAQLVAEVDANIIIGMAFGKFSQNNFVLAASLMKKAKLPSERYHDRSLDY